jgi:cytochrome P450
MVGGLRTWNFSCSFSAGFLAMMEYRDQLAWLKADPASRLNAAREELLRYTTPVIYMRRTARKDIVVVGETIKEGDKVVMYFGSANRDPAKFANPDKLDLQRTPNEHIAFGTGAHACLGQHIARIEIDAIITEVLARMDKMEVAGEPEWLPSSFISGPKKMPVRFKPGPRL